MLTNEMKKIADNILLSFEDRVSFIDDVIHSTGVFLKSSEKERVSEFSVMMGGIKSDLN